MHQSAPGWYKRPVTPQPAWRRYSKCASNACAEVAPTDGQVLMRDSKDPHRAPLAFSDTAWADFVEAIQAGELEDLL
ncbi:DUF397 domain-containing protein [Paractinoplanes toevensis]|uniref:DUF397 domain-containing protein n=1 Tax=Paractinoplanes toevensis TaxID=571911 RepID=A0A919VYD3_9ACTN|nr:DUF397 domain-containing protein [Actinoplanes toevensis]GIM88877.1 hypothetical protein Ato02nite_006700 [Actinoplanes toevensis]